MSNSDVSTDRRNGRHVTKIKQRKLDVAVVDLKDGNITEHESKHGIRLKAQKYTVFLTEQCMKHSSSHTLIVKYQCYYFIDVNCFMFLLQHHGRWRDACVECLNPHTLHNVIRKHVPSLPYLLSEYLSEYFECSKDTEINFAKLDYIKGACQNNCQIHNDSNQLQQEDKNLSYYKFERVPNHYFSKDGQGKVFYRTTRKDYCNVILMHVYELLMHDAMKYLQVYWSKFLIETEDRITWMDYSKNINLTSKYETP